MPSPHTEGSDWTCKDPPSQHPWHGWFFFPLLGHGRPRVEAAVARRHRAVCGKTLQPNVLT
jgi:hypothetical protein